VADLGVPPPSSETLIRRSYRGEVMVVIASLLFSLNGTVAKILLNAGMPAMRMTEIRSAGAFAILALWLLTRQRRALRLTRAEIPFLIIYGVFGFAAVQVFYFLAIGRLPVGIGLLFEFTAPVLIVLWVRFVRREHVKARMWAALVLALGGLALVAQIWDGLTLDGWGVAAGIAAAFSLAAYYLLGERGVQKRDTISLTTYGFGVATLFWLLIQPAWSFPYEILGESMPLGGRLGDLIAPGWMLMLYIILFGTIAPFLLVIGALRYTTAARAGMIGMLEPVGASVVAWIWLGETLTLWQVGGGLIVLAGIALAETAR
jgi:drug/metabolite transporter (DMT)-like permease